LNQNESLVLGAFADYCGRCVSPLKAGILEILSKLPSLEVNES